MLTVPYTKEGYQLLHEGCLTFSEMQQNGIRMDMKHIKTQFKRLGAEIKEQQNTLDQFKEVKHWRKRFGDKFSLDSDDQLGKILFDDLGHTPTAFTETGKPSVNAEVLENIEVPFCKILLRYRKLFKIKNTFLKGLLDESCNGYLHPFMNLHTTKTFRSSGNLPNVQNQPTRDAEAGEIIRKSFISREDHYLICTDYGGAEVRAAALLHKDPTMLKYLNDPEHSDMHADFASLLFKLPNFDPKQDGQKTLRKGTKNSFTFPQFYGDYWGNNATGLWRWMKLHGEKINPNHGVIIDNEGTTIGRHLRKNGIKTFTQFAEHVKDIEATMWDERFPVYTAWKKKHYNFYEKNGFVHILSGFICQGMMDKNAVINYPIQSISFHFLLWACTRLRQVLKENNMKTKLVFQVHDEIVADVPKDEREKYLELQKQVMIHDLKDHWDFIIVPLELEASSSELNGNWFEKKLVMKYIA